MWVSSYNLTYALLNSVKQHVEHAMLPSIDPSYRWMRNEVHIRINFIKGGE